MSYKFNHIVEHNPFSYYNLSIIKIFIEKFRIIALIFWNNNNFLFFYKSFKLIFKNIGFVKFQFKTDRERVAQDPFPGNWFFKK